MPLHVTFPRIINLPSFANELTLYSNRNSETPFPWPKYVRADTDDNHNADECCSFVFGTNSQDLDAKGK